MKAFRITTGYGDYQNHLVIADNMAEAERIFNGKYWPTTIISIELYSDYVQIQKHDEQAKG
jgi:hypothetical protein